MRMTHRVSEDPVVRFGRSFVDLPDPLDSLDGLLREGGCKTRYRARENGNERVEIAAVVLGGRDEELPHRGMRHGPVASGGAGAQDGARPQQVGTTAVFAAHALVRRSRSRLTTQWRR